jgi:hypothetical protein
MTRNIHSPLQLQLPTGLRNRLQPACLDLPYNLQPTTELLQPTTYSPLTPFTLTYTNLHHLHGLHDLLLHLLHLQQPALHHRSRHSTRYTDTDTAHSLQGSRSPPLPLFPSTLRLLVTGLCSPPHLDTGPCRDA